MKSPYEVRIVKYRFKEFRGNIRDEFGLFLIYFSKGGKPIMGQQVILKEGDKNDILSLCDAINEASKMPIIETTYIYEDDGTCYMDVGVTCYMDVGVQIFFE